MNLERKIFSKFSDHINSNFRGSISVQRTGKPSRKYLILQLIGTINATRKLYDIIEGFKEGTQLRGTEDSEKNKSNWEVWIPLKTPRSFDDHEYGEDDDRHQRENVNERPKFIYFMTSLTVLLGTLVLKSYITNSSDWTFLY